MLINFNGKSFLTLYLSLIRPCLVAAQLNMSSGIIDADKYSVAYVTVPNTEVGKTIGHGLVKNKLAACVNIIPQVTSIYEWKDEINEDSETAASAYRQINNDPGYNFTGNLQPTLLKTAFTKTYPSVSSRLGSPVDSDSVGPTSRRSIFEPEVPLECELKGYCETVPNYPHEYVNDLLSKMTDVADRFNLDVKTPEITQRRGPGEESMELCQHTETIIFPRAAKNTKDKWVFIVNRDNEPVQGFRAEMCVNIDQSCSDTAYFSDKYMATCQQKMMEKNLWSIDKDGNMIKDSIPMPSCCTCVVKTVNAM